MIFTNLMLVAFVQIVHAMGVCYWYGTFGLRATTSLFNSKRGQYPSHYTQSDRQAKYKADIATNKWVCDCIGLIKWFFWSGNDPTKPAVYKANGFPDISANMCIQSHCDKTGSIKTIPEIPGLVVWSEGHIGVYIGNGYVVEARGFAYGVVKTKLKDRPWVKWGMLKSKYITYVDGTGETGESGSENGSSGSSGTNTGSGSGSTTTSTIGKRILRKGHKGADVKELQKLLIAQGYSCGSHADDGDFWTDTDKAVRKYQKDKGLTVDGEAGPKTIGALLAGVPKPEPKPETPSEPEKPEPTDPITPVEPTDPTEPEPEKPPEGEQPTPEPESVPEPTPAPTPARNPPVIVDLSEHNSLSDKNVDWAKFKASVDLVILRCGVTRTEKTPIGIGVDKNYNYAVKKLVEYGIPFGVFWYNKIPSGKTAAQKIDWAKAEARKCWELASPYKPLFWAADVEENVLTVASVKAFAQELRVLGLGDEMDADGAPTGKKMCVGMYVGNHIYKDFADAVPAFDFIWIPHHGVNDGTINSKPNYPCDLHQYTSRGDGRPLGLVDGTIDMNRLMGTKALGWYLYGGSDANDGYGDSHNGANGGGE